MKATATNFLKFLQGTKQFVIPIYQRTYSWRISDCQQLWNDILRIAQDDEIPAHFLGSIVYVEKGIYHISSITQLLVIDGQQRLTSLCLLLTVLAEALEELGKDVVSEITKKKICNYYLFNSEETGDAHYKLVLTQNDKETLMHLLDGGDATDALSTRIKENYLFFKDQMRQSEIDPVSLYRGISKLIIVDIALEQQDNPQLIFESLNSTGMDLSQADLIRNFVLMGLDNEEQKKLYKLYWRPMEQSFGNTQSDQTQDVALFNRFMRDYLTIKLGTSDIPNMDKVYAAFKVYYQGRTHVPMEEIVEEIYRYSKYFTRMTLSREKDPEIRRILDDINTLEVYVAYPFLLEVYSDYDNQRVSREDFIAILKLVESFVFRRLMCGIPTHGLNKVFVSLAKGIKDINPQHYLENVQAAFLLLERGARFPRDEEFRAAFVIKDVYNVRSRIRHYLLSRLENHKRKERVYIDEYTIEHIMPQNEKISIEWQQELGPNWQEIHDRYLHTIGNLTLTGYNSELSDRPFSEKRTMEGGFAFSPLQLNKALALVEHWNASEIERRAQALADVAIKIWSIPLLTNEQLDRYNKRSQKPPLAEAIGPVDHPLAGYIPSGFKVIQLAEKKFHYYRLVGDKWVQYGNGKIPWFSISWENVGRGLRDSDKKGVLPFGVGGEIHPSFAKAINSDVQPEFDNVNDTNGKNVYTFDSYPYLQGDIRDLFERLRKRILNLDPLVREECNKLYVAYKTTTNFVDIEPHMRSLHLFVNMKFGEVRDPEGLCRDVSMIGHHGNGEIEVSFTSSNQLDDVMDIIRQSFEKHLEEVAV